MFKFKMILVLTGAALLLYDSSSMAEESTDYRQISITQLLTEMSEREPASLGETGLVDAGVTYCEAAWNCETEGGCCEGEVE